MTTTNIRLVNETKGAGRGLCWVFDGMYMPVLSYTAAAVSEQCKISADDARWVEGVYASLALIPNDDSDAAGFLLQMFMSGLEKSAEQA